jgi:predicted CXXCH cytochrome family protein
MISCQLIQVTRNTRGQAIREERDIAGDSLRIGRGADCIVHLPDPRIHLHHATIDYADDGKLYLESADELLNFNGEFRKRQALGLRSRVLIGPYLFIVEEKNNEHDIVLSYELIQALSDPRTELKLRSRTSLAEAGLSIRFLAAGSALIIALLFLVLPAFNAVSPELHNAAASLPVSLDESWNPGPLSASHRSIATDCQQCHRKPFVRVEDGACTTCHKNIGGHVESQTIQTSLFGEIRCASCHLEHKDNHAITKSNPALCVDCHGNLKADPTTGIATQLSDIHDFSSDHPGFKLSIKTGVNLIDIKRVSQNDKANLIEHSGLKFPHDVHLTTKGINSPNGRMVMQCSNCHSPDEAGSRYKPIVMETHCASCHRLEFEPAITSRQVPHGDVSNLMTTLREFYGSQSINETPIDVATIDGLLRRPDQTDAKAVRTRASEWANQKASVIAKDLVEVRVCITCHQVTRNREDIDKPWTIAAVNITDHWLPKNNFTHRQHSNTQCATCHQMTTSSKSSDIAIPDITTCRSCHSGANPVRNKVTSTCESCHGFHLSNHSKITIEQINATQIKTAVNVEGTP